LDCPGFESQSGEEIFLFTENVGYFPVVKRPRREVDRSRPSSAEFKNEWNSVASPLIYFLGTDKYGFTVHTLLVLYFCLKVRCNFLLKLKTFSFLYRNSSLV
jgi:hypothetical protein